MELGKIVFESVLINYIYWYGGIWINVFIMVIVGLGFYVVIVLSRWIFWEKYYLVGEF